MTQEYQMEIKPSDNDQKTPRRLLKNVIITGDNFLWLLSLNISRSYTTRPNKNNQWRWSDGGEEGKKWKWKAIVIKL